MDVNESDSAPFNFEKVHSFYEVVEQEVKDKDGNVVKDKNGLPIFEKKRVLKVIKFAGWDDSSVIRTVLQWALIRPRVKLGGLDLKMIIIVVIVLIAGVLIFSQLGGGSGGAENVIP
jgi:hypothetical protein